MLLDAYKLKPLQSVMPQSRRFTGHYIHMMERVYDMRDERPEHPAHRTISAVASSFGAPKFRLQGLAIGNGLTDPGMQVGSSNVAHRYAVPGHREMQAFVPRHHFHWPCTLINASTFLCFWTHVCSCAELSGHMQASCRHCSSCRGN